ncbi:MAG TPA: hypothetical protein PLH11_07595 [Gemmobacter sp.]|nr:hypothetical protein [Gemmobacter sp.]
MKMLAPLLIGLSLSLSAPVLAQSDPAAALRLALNEAGRKNWDRAAELAAASSAVGADLIQWQRLRAGDGTLTEYEDFLARRSDWPGLALLREKGEIAVARSTTPARVLAYFGDRLPRTVGSALAVIQALTASGRLAEAEAKVERVLTDASGVLRLTRFDG